MFLDSPDHTLDISFRVKHEGRAYMGYASSGSLRCFECGDLGHKRFACLHRRQEEGKVNVGSEVGAAVSANVGQGEAVGPSQVGHAEALMELPAVSEQENQSVDNAVPSTSGVIQLKGNIETSDMNERTAETSAAGLNDVESRLEESFSDEGGACLQENPGELGASQEWPCSGSEVSSQGASQSVYTLDEVNSFLDETYGKQVNVKDFFPDVEKFVRSVSLLQKTVGVDLLNEKKRFRLKKHVTHIRKYGTLVKKKSSSHL